MIAGVKRTPGGAVLLDGIKLRDETVAKIKETIVAAGNPKICLATVLVGDDAPSHIYVANKHKKAHRKFVWRPFWSATMHRVIYM
ncbi:MAG: hypothetical protein EBU22_05380 [Actinobacteria bacterium]|nr:hypothetical protein [Actinomycetota bacterium]